MSKPPSPAADGRSSSPSSSWLDRKWWKLSLRGWVSLALLLLAGLAILGAVFFRRRLVEHRPEHLFGVRDPAFFGSAHALADPLPVAGNKIELLHNGDQIFPALLGAIREARKTINFEVYILYSDGTGRQFRDALCERARAGVQVRVLLDGIGSGSKLDNDDVKLLHEAGCRVAYYHPVRSWATHRLNRRTHRRILVVDGRLGFTGSVGFADEWTGDAQDKDHWRDVQARMEGPLVGRLQAAFQQHWMDAAGEPLSGEHQFPPLEPAGNLRGQVVISTGFQFAPVPFVQAQAIAAAERNVLITNAYCTPTADQVDLLSAAVKRGVDVRLLLPGKHNDMPATKTAGRTAYGKLLEGGVKIFEYQPTMVHQKTMVVDGRFSMLGSSNLDARSAQINEELDVTVDDDGFGRQMEEVFERDLQRSKPYTLEDFRRRPAWERLTEWLVLPFRSQL